MEDGTPIKIVQNTGYPWEGVVDISVSPAHPSPFTFYLRIPGWAEHAAVSVNSKAMGGVTPGQYFPLHRRWSAGDALRITMDMRPEMLMSDPRVAEDTGRVALQRGPLLYCMEEMSAGQIARSLHCSKPTILRRLDAIEARTGAHPDNLRRLSPHLNKIEAQLADPRAEHIHRTPALLAV